jgi:hypothetical protein
MQALFQVCYRIQPTGMGGAWWMRVALPVAGGGGEQPARVMAALELMEAVANNELQRSMKQSRASDE